MTELKKIFWKVAIVVGVLAISFYIYLNILMITVLINQASSPYP